MLITNHLPKISGLIHIGAHQGQERDIYQNHDIKVLWIEANPFSYNILINNIQSYNKQKAINALLTDQNNLSYSFGISSNDGASSSVLELNLHKEIWPEISYIDYINLVGYTLPYVLNTNNISINDYNALVLDTQGSELMILNGAKDILNNIQYIQVEAANFESYKNCASIDTISDFLTNNGYVLCEKELLNNKDNKLYYYDLLFIKKTILV